MFKSQQGLGPVNWIFIGLFTRNRTLSFDYKLMRKLYHNCLLPLATLFASIALADPEYESPPTVAARDLVPATVLSGENYTVDENVATDGFMGTFVIRSKYGDFECHGREMFYTRLSEVHALNELEKVSRTKAFAEAIKNAAEEPAKAAVKIATNPVGSAVQAPLGAARLFGDVMKGAYGAGRSAVNVTKPKENHPKPPPDREDPIGYNKSRNEWARRICVDPYTSNRVLAIKLNHLAMISFGTDKVAGAAIGFGLGALGPIAAWCSWLPDIDEHLLTAPPAEVSKINAARLRRLGVSRRAMKPFLANKWFTPTLQIRYVNALERLKGVDNIAAAMLVAGEVQSEEEARFLCGCVAMLEHYHTTVAPLRTLTTQAGLPAAVSAGGNLVVAAPADLIAWTPVSAGFAKLQNKGEPAILCVSGLLTKRAREGFLANGWKVREFSLPFST